jgi:hypothetical protein
VADVAVPFVLTTPGGTITFNDDSADQHYITEIGGLGSAPVRAPIDNVPFGDGGIVHNFWKGPRHITIEGVWLITSTRIMNSIVVIRNDMEEDLRAALESTLQANGTLAWTPQGQAARSLTVRQEIAMDTRHIENYNLRSFTFGLVAGDPDW